MNVFLAFWVRIGDEAERKIYLPYNDNSQWRILEREIPGSLETAEVVSFRYDANDIMCIEMLELSNLNGSLHFNINQDYDPYAWEPTPG